MGHNSKKVFRRFSELQIGDEIKVTTTYGEYNYKIYDMQLINETELEKVPIQKDEEILMVYTCYPFNNVGYATQRYVVYAKLEKQEGMKNEDNNKNFKIYSYDNNCTMFNIYWYKKYCMFYNF